MQELIGLFMLFPKQRETDLPKWVFLKSYPSSDCYLERGSLILFNLSGVTLTSLSILSADFMHWNPVSHTACICRTEQLFVSFGGVSAGQPLSKQSLSHWFSEAMAWGRQRGRGWWCRGFSLRTVVWIAMCQVYWFMSEWCASSACGDTVCLSCLCISVWGFHFRPIQYKTIRGILVIGYLIYNLILYKYSI